MEKHDMEVARNVSTMGDGGDYEIDDVIKGKKLLEEDVGKNNQEEQELEVMEMLQDEGDKDAGNLNMVTPLNMSSAEDAVNQTKILNWLDLRGLGLQIDPSAHQPSVNMQTPQRTRFWKKRACASSTTSKPIAEMSSKKRSLPGRSDGNMLKKMEDKE